MTIQIFTTGGTIDKCYSTEEGDFVVGQSILHQVLQEANVETPHVVEPLFRKDSLDITAADRDLIRAAVVGCSSSKVIITHGTDTLIQTAKALDGISDKTVVLTGALQPAAFKITDALFNVGYAFAMVQLLSTGTYIAFNGSVFDPHHVVKNAQENRFEARE